MIRTWLVAPFCSGHRWHWASRRVVIPLALIAFIIVWCSGFGLFAGKGGHETFDLLLIAGVVGFLCWVAFAITVCYAAIRITGVEGDALLVRGVAPEFIAALQDYRKSSQRDQRLELPGLGRTRRQVRLFRDELRTLPAICVCCGEPGPYQVLRTYKTVIRKQWTTRDALAAFSPGGNINLGEEPGTPWCVYLPVCRRHRTYWRDRLSLMVSGFVVLGLGIAGGYARWVPDASATQLMVASLIGILLWAVGCGYIYEHVLTGADATEQCLILRPVAARFVEAVEQRRLDDRSIPDPSAIVGSDIQGTEIQLPKSQLPKDAYGPPTP